MAVSNQQSPNLAPSYENVLGELNTQAQLAAKTPTTAGAIGDVANTQADYAQQRSKLAYQASLEDQLAQHKSQYEAQMQGRMPTTQADIDQEWQDNKLPQELKPKISGTIYLSPGDKMAMSDKAKYERDLESVASDVDQKQGTQQGDLIRFLGRDKNNTNAISQIASGGRISWILDASTGYHIAVNAVTKQPVPNMPPLELMGGSLDSTGGVKVSDPTKLDPITRKAVQPVISKAIADPEINKDIDKLQQIDQIKQAIASKNPTATINIKSETGQSIGQMSPSRMAAGLLQQEGTDPSIIGQLKQKWSTLKDGTLSPDNQKYIAQQLDDTAVLIKKRVDANVGAKAQDVINASGNKLDPVAARKMVSSRWDSYMNSQQQQSPQTSIMTDPKTGKKYNVQIDANGKRTIIGEVSGQ